MKDDATTIAPPADWTVTRDEAQPIPAEKPASMVVDELYREHASDIHRYLFALCRSEEDAHDAVQDAFINLYGVLSRGGTIAQPRAWLVAVSRRLLINRLRKAKHDEVKHTEFSRIAEEVFQSGRTTHQAMEDKQRLRRAVAAIGGLSERERRCLAARAQGMKFREVSLLTGLDYRRCFDVWAQAIGKLRKVMKDA